MSGAAAQPPPAGEGAAAPPRQRVEISVPARTLLQLLGFAALVALALLSLGTLISILLAAVLAVGLDPVVGALVRRVTMDKVLEGIQIPGRVIQTSLDNDAEERLSQALAAAGRA